jgi:hypothetical protein
MPAIKNSGAIIPEISKIRVTALNQNKLNLKCRGLSLVTQGSVIYKQTIRKLHERL